MHKQFVFATCLSISIIALGFVTVALAMQTLTLLDDISARDYAPNPPRIIMHSTLPVREPPTLKTLGNCPTNDEITCNVETLRPHAEIVATAHESEASDRRFIGYFEVTAYTISPQCLEDYYNGAYSTTATMTTPTLRTAASCWTILPPGTEIYVSGNGWRVIEDTGGALRQRARDVDAGQHDTHLLDIFLPTLEAANNWGRRIVRIYERA